MATRYRFGYNEYPYQTIDPLHIMFELFGEVITTREVRNEFGNNYLNG